MLSASQGKYELERSSGRIANEINYIYYFTYFHEYDIHPFWDKFETEINPIIKGKVEELKESIKCLKETHKTLKKTVISTYSNPKNLFETIETINCDIDTIYKILNCYIECKLKEIKLQLECKKRDFDQKLKCSCPKLSSEILFVKKTLKITTKITYTFKRTIETMSEIKDGKLEYTKIYNEVIEEISKCEETVELKGIERRLQTICDYIKNLLPTTNSLPNLSDLTCDSFDFNKKINEIDEYILCLEDTILKLNRREEKFVKIVREVDTKEHKTGGSGGHSYSSQQNQNCTGNSTEFSVYYHYVVNIKETIIKYTHHIQSIKTEVCSEIQKLVNEITCFKQKLEKVKKELEDLQCIMTLNEVLQDHVRVYGRLNKIRGYANYLKYGEDDEDIEIGLKSFNNISYYYYYCIDLIKKTVESLLHKTEIKHACFCNPDLVCAKAALECVKDNLCKLESIGKSIPDLIEIAPTIAQLVGLLQKVGNLICRLKNELQQLESKLETTSKQLDIMTRFRDTVEHEIRTMERYIEAIKEIKEAGEKIKELYQAYTAEFSKFKEAITSLETCIDYLFRDFLRCSLCTTVCRLKRQLLNTPGECPDSSSECTSCQTTTLMTDKVYVLQTYLHRYVFSVLGHFSAIDTKVFISKLYRCILRVDDIVRIVQVVDCCCCVKKLHGNDSDRADKTNQVVNANHPKARMMKYRQYVNHVKSKDKEHLNLDTLDRLSDTDNSNHLCLCLAIRHKLYPCLLKTVTLLVQLELGVSGNIAKKFGTHSKYKSYYKQYGCNSYNTHSSYNSYTLSLSILLLLSTWVMMKLATSLQYRYTIEHDKVKCCTKDKGKCECKCEHGKDSPSNKCCQCCKCPKANGSPPVPPATTPKECCCTKVEGSKGCLQTKCKEDNSNSCCCRCCCQCVCEKKRECGCTCKPEQHCFCSKYSGEYREDCYYRWFIYVIFYICHLVEDAFSLGYWETAKAMQSLSNLIPRLDAVCWHSDKRCVTISDKGSGGGGEAVQATSTELKAKPEESQPAQASPAVPCSSALQASTPACPQAVQTTTSATSSPQPPLPKVKCCLVCVNVKVVCVSTHVLCVTSVLIGKCNKPDGKKEECNPEAIDCFCKCEDCKSCLDRLKKLAELETKLKCELFKALNEKLENLKKLNGDKDKWTVNCDCKDAKPKCPCKEVTKGVSNPCEKLKELSKVKTEEFKCGCESVVKCCCCCKCEECGNGKSRHCNKKEEGKDKHKCQHSNGHGSGNGNGQGTTQAASPNGQGNCPCIKNKNGETDKECCCNTTGAGGNRKCCNSTKGKPEPAKTTECQCCCLSCCADEKKEDEKDKEKEEDKDKKEGEKKEDEKKEGEKKCPCKKKKKKEKKKVHCKNNKKYKDKRCCCKCRPKENGEGGSNSTIGGSNSSAPTSTAPSSSTQSSSPNGATTSNDKECCCCCKCKSTCKAGASGPGTGVGGSGVTNTNGKGCTCHNDKDKEKNGQQSDCNCYCCSECDHGKSALKSVCKQLAYQLNSGILVLSKLASNLSIECCEGDHQKLRDTLKDYLDRCNQRFPKTCLTATRTGRGCDISNVMVGGKTSLSGGNTGANPNIGETNVTFTVIVIVIGSVIGTVTFTVIVRAIPCCIPQLSL